MNRKKILIGIIILLGVSVFGTLLSKYLSPKVLRLGYTEATLNLDPAKAYDDETLSIIGQVYEPLYQYHYLIRPFKIEPLLAEALPEVSNEGKTYTIKIKPNIYYHQHMAFDGKQREVIAEDFVNQIKRLAFIPLGSAGEWIFRDNMQGFIKLQKELGTNWRNIFSTKFDGAIAKDKYTLELNFKRADNRIPYFLAMSFVVPIPKEVISYSGNQLSLNIVGTGPFYVENINNRNDLILKKFPYYRKTYYPTTGDAISSKEELLKDAGKVLPLLDEVIIKHYSTKADLWQAYNEDEIDLLEVPKQNLPDIVSQNNKGKLQFFSDLSVRWLAFNQKDKLLGKNKQLRLAIAHAIDYENYIKELTYNSSARASSMFVPGIPGFDPKKKPYYSFNLVKAKKYLAEAGYVNGEGLPIITLTTRDLSASSLKAAKLIERYLLEIGIKLRINQVSFSRFLTEGRAGKLQLWIDNWIYDYPDAENILQLLISSNHPGVNKSAINDSYIDGLYRMLLSLDNRASKFKIMSEIESLVENEAYWVMLYFERTYVLLNEDIYNYQKSSFIRNNLKYLNQKTFF